MMSYWVEKAYVDGGVWKDISEFVSEEAISSTTKIYDEFALILNKRDRILSHVSQYVYPSELKEFAVKGLGLRETRCEMIEEDHIYAKRRNFEVNIKTSQKILIKLFSNLIL